MGRPRRPRRFLAPAHQFASNRRVPDELGDDDPARTQKTAARGSTEVAQMRRIVAGIALGLCVLCPRPAFAWGEVGHRVVGRIAASQLTQAARARVAKILGVANTKAAVADALSDAAEWPDAVARTKYKKTVDWHFIDLGVKPNASKDNTLWASSDTAFARIIKYAGTIKARMPDELEPGSDLEFVAH